jgi:tRNA U54 and U55 pseudouridine synthase Pus10
LWQSRALIEWSCDAIAYSLARYLKLKRGVPQSKWIDPETGVRIGAISLAERIEEVVLPFYGASESKFVTGEVLQ